ncbi:hypothetical protein [Paenibacillus sp. NAIST15-1]|uniref:hypothetical protein n=1 Tax=Paenibacillus sp. NAIST15-1 TaxID=1605994 RepID=UPI0008691526|nr:hypothetical protein [Paenibacillus sp. NAIST15-1]GAV14593.1 metallo-beta-lactamase domain protein [Paenibacillus sp. NAIST15-1]
MKQFGWFIINLMILSIIIYISSISYGIYTSAEIDIATLGFEKHYEVYPKKDAYWFSFLFAVAGILCIMLSQFQRGSEKSKILISFLIILIHILFILNTLLSFAVNDEYPPLTIMTRVANIISIIVILLAGIDLIGNFNKAADNRIRKMEELT